MYRNIEARSFNDCCSVKAINITYCKYVFVALGTEQANGMCRAVFICGLSESTVFFHIKS